MAESNLTVDRARELLSYDIDTGVFRWRVSRGRASIGSAAGSVHRNGYHRIKVDGHLYLSHRLAWLYTYGAWPEAEIDHINGVRTDNRISNLRDVTRSEQNRNTKLQSNNTSGVAGVFWHKRAGKWQAHVKVDGRLIHLGLFKDFDKAVAARKAAEVKHGFHKNHGLTAEQRARGSL